MMFKPTLVCSTLLAASIALSACSKVRGVGEDEYQDYRTKGPERGRMFGDSSMTLGVTKGSSGGADEGAALGVNAYLWRGALDTLGFMPLASADPFGGVIITDWYQPPNGDGERFKATAYILGRQLRADGIRVSIFRQVLRNGQWVDAPVSPVTTGEIENKVLARARELRSQTASN
jgi:predicted small secreted protein